MYSGKITNIHYLNGEMTFETTSPHTMESTYLPHSHPNPHICLVLQGGNVERRKQGVYERLPGDLVFYPSGETHYTVKKHFPSTCINLEFDHCFLQNYELSEDSIQKRISQKMDVKFLLLKMYRELLVPDAFTPASIQLLLLGLVNESIRLNNLKKPAWVTLLYEILNDRWNEPLTLTDLSILLKIHPVTISRYFSTYFSCTFGEYRRKLKINKSLSLIRNTPLSLTDIALECGFADQSHFIRAFREITGFLPGKIRNLS